MAPGFGFGFGMSPFWASPCLSNAYVPGFYDSQINRDMIDLNGHWNIKPNLMMETMLTDSLMFKVRNLKFNQYTSSPYFEHQ